MKMIATDIKMSWPSLMITLKLAITYVRFTRTTAKMFVITMKPLFTTYGIPDVIILYNGPQYSFQEFQQFAKDYEFKHNIMTISSYHA